MSEIKIQTPAKINLTLEVLDKRADGFHNIQSIMQAVSLYDYLTINVDESQNPDNEIVLTGTSDEIPYDEKNIVYKAAKLYLETIGVQNKKISIHIEKNIPVSAGLAGGSANASGAFFGMNELFSRKLSREELHNLVATLGSDLNFCLDGGCALCLGRGEIIEKLPVAHFKVSLIKPKNLSISAKEAYQKFALLKDKSNPDNTTKLKALLMSNKFDKSKIYNSLEAPLLKDYSLLNRIKNNVKNSLMSGSGPTFFVIDDLIGETWSRDEFDVFNGLTSVNFGVKTV